ncbi:hypothetical protein LRP88_03337 [Fusarium phalaenopsidis]|nr:NACHT domain-containing protein [Fusarium sp. Ph1]
MSSEVSANITINIGNVNLGPGATATLGMNRICSDSKAEEQAIKQCKDALFISEPSSVRAELLNIKGSLAEGTCQWIRRNETYQSWLSAQDSNLLWISGGPGRGKTMLSIFLTLEWETLPDRVLYVFCGDKSTNDELTILRSLLYQVLSQCPGMVSHVEDHLGSEERTNHTLSSRGDLWAMFTSILKDSELGPVLCLIDGLDECHRDSTRWLLNNLRHVFDKESSSRLSPFNPFRLAIVSRDIPGLRIYPRLNLETKTRAIEKDVTRVIDAKMKEHGLFSELDDEFIEEVKTTLQRRSDGTFLWVGFAIQELLSVETKTEMRDALNAIPRDLGTLYSKILLRIKGPRRGMIAQLLRWVALACHSLTVSQLADALDVDAQTILDLVDMSGSLLTLSEHRNWDIHSSKIPTSAFPTLFGLRHTVANAANVAKVVKLVHSSVGDFLKGESNDGILPPRKFRIRVEEADLQITQRCLREVKKFFSHSPALEEDIAANALSSYATFFWPQHARRCGKRLKRLVDSDNAFFRGKEGMVIWSRWWNAYCEPVPSNFKKAGSLDLTPLHVSSALGLQLWTKKLLQPTALARCQVDATDCNGWTPLCYALDQGHTAVAQLLVDHGASLTRDIKQKDSLGNNTQGFKPIHKAMELGPEFAEPFLNKALKASKPRNRLVRWLPFLSTNLKHSADLKHSTNLKRSLFRKAAVLGDERFIHILFNNGVTLDSDIAQLALKDALENGAGEAFMNLLQHTASTDI